MATDFYSNARITGPKGIMFIEKDEYINKYNMLYLIRSGCFPCNRIRPTNSLMTFI